MAEKPCALIVGAGSGLSASLARLFAKNGFDIALAARDPAKLEALAGEVGARSYACDASLDSDVSALFDALATDFGDLEIAVYNPSFRTRGPLIEIVPADVQKSLAITCYGAFLVGQAAARVMLPRGKGSIFFTGASAGVKGYPQSAPFAMGKFALRGLAQSMARELSPQGLHIAHFVIDGGIRPEGVAVDGDKMLEADAIAESYLHVHQQHRSAWSWEVEVRPWVETF